MSNFHSNGGSFLSKGKIIAGLIGLFALIVFIVGVTSFEAVPVGHEGYQYISYGGNKGLDQNTIYKEGKSWIAPWNDLILISVQEQSRDYHSEVLDKDGLDVTVDCIVNYQLTRGVGGNILSEVGHTWEEKIVDKSTRGAIRDVAGKYTAEQLYSAKRDQMEVEIKEKIQSRLSAYDIVLVEIEISDVDLPEPIQKAIVDKMEQEQKNSLSEKLKIESFNKAQAKIETARGDSASAVINAAGKAAAYRLESRELNDRILRKLELDAWRAGGSQVPTVMGGESGFIINLGGE